MPLTPKACTLSDPGFTTGFQKRWPEALRQADLILNQRHNKKSKHPQPRHSGHWPLIRQVSENLTTSTAGFSSTCTSFYESSRWNFAWIPKDTWIPRHLMIRSNLTLLRNPHRAFFLVSALFTLPTFKILTGRFRRYKHDFPHFLA